MQQTILIRVLADCVGTARDVAVALRLWRRRARSRIQLAELSPVMLADIGLSELDRRRECNKWFWED